jgi:hypothetical protein
VRGGTLKVCGTCGIVMPQQLWSGARVVSGPLCAHKNEVVLSIVDGTCHDCGKALRVRCCEECDRDV